MTINENRITITLVYMLLTLTLPSNPRSMGITSHYNNLHGAREVERRTHHEQPKRDREGTNFI